MTRRVVVFSGVLFLSAAATLVAQRTAVTVQQLAWMQGCWAFTDGARNVEEQWMAPRGDSMVGMSRTVRNGRLQEFELVVVKESAGRLEYHAHPSGQPGAVFVASKASDTEVVFENPEHDFPQEVGYRRDGSERLSAWIAGALQGKPRRVDFPYQRVSCTGEP